MNPRTERAIWHLGQRPGKLALIDHVTSHISPTHTPTSRQTLSLLPTLAKVPWEIARFRIESAGHTMGLKPAPYSWRTSWIMAEKSVRIEGFEGFECWPGASSLLTALGGLPFLVHCMHKLVNVGVRLQEAVELHVCCRHTAPGTTGRPLQCFLALNRL